MYRNYWFVLVYTVTLCVAEEELECRSQMSPSYKSDGFAYFIYHSIAQPKIIFIFTYKQSQPETSQSNCWIWTIYCLTATQPINQSINIQSILGVFSPKSYNNRYD